MKRSILAARREVAIRRLQAAIEQLVPETAVDLDDPPRQPDVEHRELWLLERLADLVEPLAAADVPDPPEPDEVPDPPESDDLVEPLAAADVPDPPEPDEVPDPPEPDDVFEPPPDDLTDLHGVGPARAAELNAKGIFTFAQLATADADWLHTTMEVSRQMVDAWQAEAVDRATA